MIKYLLILALTGCVAIVQLGAAAKDSANTKQNEPEVNSVLASVNGEPILLGDVLPMTRTKELQSYAAYSGKRLEQAIRELRRAAVDELIERKLVIADYYRQQVRIQSRDVEAELDRIAVRMNCNSRKAFWRKLRENGIDFDEFKKNIEQRMIVQLMRYRQAVISGEVTPKDVYEYFQKHQKEFAGVETIELAMLKIDNNRPDFKEAVAVVEQNLSKTPDDFHNMVRRYTPEFGDGKLGVIESSKLRPEFQCILKDLVIGKIYGPIKIDDGTVWLKLLAHTPPKNVKFSEVEETIKGKLNSEIRNKLFKKYTGELRKDALVEYFF